jgi:hypothetical protein
MASMLFFTDHQFVLPVIVKQHIFSFVDVPNPEIRSFTNKKNPLNPFEGDNIPIELEVIKRIRLSSLSEQFFYGNVWNQVYSFHTLETCRIMKPQLFVA